MAFEVVAITPAKWGIDPRVLEAEIRNAIDHTVNILGDDYAKTTRTWRSKPKFEKTRPTRKSTALEASVSTRSKLFRFVDRGTRPHIIRPKRAGGRLAFNTRGFRAKTRSGVVGSRGGRRAGPPKAFAKQVRHPGTKARNFTVTIVKRRSRNARNLVRNALIKSLKRPPAVKR